MGKILACCLLLLLAACHQQGPIKDLHEYVVKLKQTVASRNKNTSTLSIKEPEIATFSTKITRSPFAKIGAVTKDSAARVTHPLQSYPLNMLRFTGTLSEDDTTSGFVVTPDNRIYQVKLGDEIGDNYGKIIKIHKDRLEIVEEQVSDQGKVTTQRIVTLQMKDQGS